MEGKTNKVRSRYSGGEASWGRLAPEGHTCYHVKDTVENAQKFQLCLKTMPVLLQCLFTTLAGNFIYLIAIVKSQIKYFDNFLFLKSWL